MKRRCLFISLLLAYSFITLAQTNDAYTHFNHFVFKVPPGWKTAQNGSYMTVTAPATTIDELLSFILFPPDNRHKFYKRGQCCH